MIQGLRAPGFRLEKLAVWGFAGSLALGAGLAHHAAQAAIFADDEARKAILDLRIRFEESRNQLQEQTKQIQNLSAQIQKLGAQIQAFDAELKDTQQSVQKKADGQGQLGVQSDMERLRQELARARGQIEDLVNELSITQKRQRDLDQLVDKRIGEVKVKVGEVDNRLSAFEPLVVNVDGVEIRVDPTEKRLFDGAIESFRAGDFKQSANQLRNMMDRFPDTNYMPSLVFWFGSANYAQREYKGAITSFTAFLKSYAEHPRAADARLNLGLAQADAGERAVARKTLQSLIERHPESNAAMVAKERLSKLK
ncbi:MAG: outer membrane protein assembly factor BamD [Betaproteobacteria bacterium]|nr:outer membrane protein assembly factor BamD [Betaproteobacteria bacterium]NCV25326.1 outer membrane protein assembly factor BamD [Betaproteobacteria bacterium]NCW19407.1 outer membrane protein assembly factor BamD [Betaproteobacteria bacterium]NCZ47931.1 outer membrane protein assembly factor BamD [Betaproteobacteria bacterium]NCZ58748.1 outer membrane protein assembly factor BamD [Betaproteobacteria bacterium]